MTTFLWTRRFFTVGHFMRLWSFIHWDDHYSFSIPVKFLSAMCSGLVIYFLFCVIVDLKCRDCVLVNKWCVAGVSDHLISFVQFHSFLVSQAVGKCDTMLKVLMLPSSKVVALQVLYLYRVLAWHYCASRVDFWLLGNFFARRVLLYRHFCEPFLVGRFLRLSSFVRWHYSFMHSILFRLSCDMR